MASRDVLIEAVECINTRSYQMGGISKLENLAFQYNKRAGDAFTLHQDDKANILRQLADELKAQVQAQRKDYEDEGRAQVADAWKTVDTWTDADA